MKKASKTVGRKRGPSAASLREIPEVDLKTTLVLGRGDAGLTRARAFLKAARGRPPEGQQAPGSSPRSIRFSDAMWRQLEREARKRRTTLHALLRDVIAEWLERAA